ncbi:MAG: hypothetical protein ACHBN1_32280 [Heteroscytonema crispum UTEX LB 1556]
MRKKVRCFTTSPTGSQSPGSGKRHLLHLGRPQDRSGGPTKSAKRAGGNLPDCRLRAVSPLRVLCNPFGLDIFILNLGV